MTKMVDRSNSRGEATANRRPTSTILIVVLNSVVLITLHQLLQLSSTMSISDPINVGYGSVLSSSSQEANAISSSSYPFGLVIPQGHATPLPSIQTTEEEEATISRQIYGGKGDKAHLGGFTSFDPMGVSPTLWTHMINHLGIKSLVDIGCGRGISTSWFVTHGLPYVVCAEGSHDAVTQSLLPTISKAKIPDGTKFELVEHDFSRGPWWPERTVDAAWCVEFTEHVGRNFQKNYHTAFRKAALVFATHSNWGGWHHVEVHSDDWWRVRMEAAGFVYSDLLTKEMRSHASKDSRRTDLILDMKAKNKTSYNVGQHLWANLQVFINPLVASLPEHQHLFAEHGCYQSGEEPRVECGTGRQGHLTPLPQDFKPLKLTKEMDDTWYELVKDLKMA